VYIVLVHRRPLIVSNILTSCDEWGISTAKDVYCTVAVNDEYSRNTSFFWRYGDIYEDRFRLEHGLC